MKTENAQIEKLASLAYIKLDALETTNLCDDLNDIIYFINQLTQVNTEGVEPLMHPVDSQQSLRPDEPKNGNTTEHLARIAPQFSEGLYLVPKVIDSEK